MCVCGVRACVCVCVCVCVSLSKHVFVFLCMNKLTYLSKFVLMCARTHACILELSEHLPNNCFQPVLYKKKKKSHVVLFPSKTVRPSDATHDLQAVHHITVAVDVRIAAAVHRMGTLQHFGLGGEPHRGHW